MAAGGPGYLAVRLLEIQALPLGAIVQADCLDKDPKTLTLDKLTALGGIRATSSNFYLITDDPSKTRGSKLDFFGTTHGGTFKGASGTIAYYWAFPNPAHVTILHVLRFEGAHEATLKSAGLPFQRVPGPW
jgi:hypothetical protein